VRRYLKKLITKIWLVEWLMVKALSSSPSTTQKNNNTNIKISASDCFRLILKPNKEPLEFMSLGHLLSELPLPSFK
jgi:hypothetical protein